ncbi:MAG: hypothetical protein VW709_20150 [Rickettsiales bacterium]|jgi:hypothetical protein
MRRLRGLFVGALAALMLIAGNADAAAPKRVKVSGEIVDTWCYITEIMYALGSAHHRCAIWCAVGGIPVSLKGNDGNTYMVLKMEGDGTNVANPAVLKIQSHEVSVEGDLYERDGVKYLIVTQVHDDKGVVNMTHKEYGVQP